MRTSNLVIGLVLLNAAAAFLTGSGVAADLGIQPEPGGDQQVNQATNESKDLQPSKGGSSTLFDLFVSVATGIFDIFTLAFAGPLFFTNLGAPSWLVSFVFAPIYIIVGLDVAHLLTGRDTD